MIFDEAKRIWDLGGAVHWLHPRQKRPIENAWTTGPRKTWKELKELYRDGMNVGIRTGEPSKIGLGYLACIDLDVKDPTFKDELLEKLKEVLEGEICPEVRSGSGNGSRHLYCVTAKPFKMITVLKVKDRGEICVYSDGRQMALPPSVHPNGKLYKWKSELTSAADLPLLDFNRYAEAPSKKKEKGVAADAVDLSGFEISPVDIGWLTISDEMRAAISLGVGVTDRSGYLLKASSALLSAGLTENEVLTVLTDPDTFLGQCGYDHAHTKSRKKAAEWVYRYTLKRVSAERSASQIFGALPVAKKLTAEELEAQNTDLGDEVTWQQSMDQNKQGYEPTLKNLDLIFSHQFEKPIFIKDVFANRIAYAADTAWGGKNGAYIEDIDMILVKRWCASSRFQFEPHTNAVLEATALVAHRERVHPVTDWLDRLEWDGVSRVDTWIKDYCEGRAPEPYLSEVSRKFLLAMVKRVYQPGCQWDYVLVLEGKQGKYKSSIARALASDRWFMDNLPDLKDKDAMLNLQGKWLIELGELTNVKRSDHNLVKAYLVRRMDTVRPHYGRIMADVPRQSVFIGTVNEGEYLKDPTGNRRFWPVSVGTCDVAGLTSVRDQLFAEAVHIYKTTNEILMLGEEGNMQAVEEQEGRRVEDDLTEMRDELQDFMRREDQKFNFERFKSRDLFEGPNVPWSRWNGKPYASQNAAQVLAGLGFQKGKSGGQRVWSKTSEILGHSKGSAPNLEDDENFY